MKKHSLKIRYIYWPSILSEEKTCEIRINDRDYQKGDQISFELEFAAGRTQSMDDISFEITHVLNFPEGLRDGYVAFSIKKITPTL